MNQNYQLTVEQILQRPQFRHAYVAGGQPGLSRLVRWVHIIEVIQFEELLQGGEMILTTGAAFGTSIGLFETYMEQLIRRDVACLCIELGHSIQEVPEAWVRLAEVNGLPLIVFPQAVRFIDITQDIHAHIINRHHDALQDLERISREFHRLTLTSQGVNHVLQLLHRSTQAQILYIAPDGQSRCVPYASDDATKRWTKLLLEHMDSKPLDKQSAAALPYHIQSGRHTMIAQPVGAMGKTWAHLALILDRQPQQFEYLILDSASLSIAQDLLRKRYMEERKLYSQTLWIDDLLHLRIRDEEGIKALIGPDYKRNNELPYRVCLIEITRESGRATASSLLDENEDALGLHLSLAARAIFEQQGFYPLITIQNDRLVVIAFDRLPTKPAKDRLRHAIASLRAMKDEEDIGLTVGIGGTNRGYMNAYLSYQEAIQAISLSGTLGSDILFFDELGVFQLLFHIGDKAALHTFMRSSLGPLLDHDQSKGSELLRTLKVYLDHDGSKQLAAQRLFIARQSLYYRLEQIEALLGSDYMEPEKRLALGVAIRVYQLLNPDA
ncbi:PucR family transcriptional regulator ligand-binding domain-containing protein [Paenibacillus sp. PL2-23]|uniref:PucR family transcriptional regulator n=1 Tax=Paenibacillus sp. PL2-23 TaxID=2100729 RepID=UPI0030FBB2DC